MRVKEEEEPSHEGTGRQSRDGIKKESKKIPSSLPLSSDPLALSLCRVLA